MDNLIQEVTRQVFRVVGRTVLSQGLGGGGGNGDSNGSGRGRVSVSLPTFPPDEDDEEEEEDDTSNSSTSSSTTSTLSKTPVNTRSTRSYFFQISV